MARAAVVNLGDGFAARVLPGKEDVVFWIHGYTLDSTCWIRLWDHLPNWAHISIDLPGHGNSLPLNGSEELSTLARKIGTLAIAHRARHLIALSFGTVIALQIALEYPDAFATLTLGAPFMGGGPFDPQVWIRYKEVKALFRQAGYGPKIRDCWMGPGTSLFRNIETRPQLWDQLRHQVGRHPWWELSDDSYFWLWHTPHGVKELCRIGLPTLLLVGEEDCEAVKQCAHVLERVISRCQRCDLPGLGHLCLLEDPAYVQPFIEQHWRAKVHQRRSTVSNDHAAHD